VRFRGFCRVVASDLYRHTGAADARSFVRCMLMAPGFSYTFWFRSVAWLRQERSVLRLLYPIAGLVKRHFSLKYGISIPAETRIGPGFYIGHHGGIVVSPLCRIGRDCSISQGVTIGVTTRGSRRGAPVLGDRVYVAPGAKIVGAVRVGSNVAVGANAVVVADVPDDAVVVGVPARVVSFAGSAGYVRRTEGG
jgi:serine O-acetyltransferase